MATVHIVRAYSIARGKMGGNLPVASAAVLGAETITSSASSQQSALTAARSYDEIFSVTVSGGDAWVAFGSEPTAAPGQDWLILDGQTREFAVRAGDKVAVVDA